MVYRDWKKNIKPVYKFWKIEKNLGEKSNIKLFT